MALNLVRALSGTTGPGSWAPVGVTGTAASLPVEPPMAGPLTKSNVTQMRSPWVTTPMPTRL